MARTGSFSSILASTSNAAAGTTNSSSVNNTTAYGGRLEAQMTNGGTGPTVGCTATMQASIDGTTWVYGGQSYTAGVTASTTYSVTFIFQDEGYVRVQFTGNTGQAVTCAAQAHQTTGI